MWRRWTQALLLAGLLWVPTGFCSADEGEEARLPEQDNYFPVCTHIPSLKYPAAIQDRSQEGTVVVLAYVDEKGRVEQTEVLDSDLPELFIVEALKAARHSRFRPDAGPGRPSRIGVVMPFRFDALEPPARPAAEAPSGPTAEAPSELTAEAPSEPTAEAPSEPTAEAPSEQGRTEPETPVSEHRPADAGADSQEVATPDKPREPTRSDFSHLELVAGACGRGISLGELTESDTRFSIGERVYFWTRIRGAVAGDKIHHVWIFRGRAVQEIELELKGADWRTWSYKTLFGGLAGEWLVELRDLTGRTLGSRTFICEEAPAPAGDN